MDRRKSGRSKEIRLFIKSIINKNKTMAGLNKVSLIGNLGKDPELRTLEGGVNTVSFPFATSESYKDKNGDRQENTEWHNIVAWRAIADNINKLLKKGSTVYIEGKLKTRTWTTKEGDKKYMTEIIVDQFILLKDPK